MLLGNTVKFAQMPFCLIPKVLNAVDVVLPVGKMCTMVDAQMAKLADIQHIIALIAICINDAVSCGIFVNTDQLSCRSGGNACNE